MADEIVIVTSTDRLPLTYDETVKLLEHIWRDGGPAHTQAEETLLAATEQDGQVEVRLTDESKDAIHQAISSWLDAEGAWDVPGAVMDLRIELARDLKLRPFDE